MNKTSIALMAALAAAPLAGAWGAGQALSPSDVRTLDESSTALADVKPTLSQRLHDYAVKEANEREGSERARTPDQEKEDVSLLKDAADALRNSRPDLSRRLDRLASKEKRAQEAASPARRRIERQQREQGY